MTETSAQTGKFADSDSCLEWIKDWLNPEGVTCRKCGTVTAHHKVTGRQCYVCGRCGRHYYPLAGTMFQKSSTPLVTWFGIIRALADGGKPPTARGIARRYGLTYKTAWRIVTRVKAALGDRASLARALPETGEQPVNAKGGARRPRARRDASLVLHQEELAVDTGQDMRRHRQRRTQIVRLLRLQTLLYQHAEGLTIDDITALSRVSRRTVYRDLQVLDESGVPIWEDGRKRGIAEGYFLPPVNFTMEEATDIFLAARLMQNYTSIFPSTFIKLNAIVPPPLRRHLNNVLIHSGIRPDSRENKRKRKNFSVLVHGWLFQHKVRIHYQYPGEDEPKELVISPYFIEPSLKKTSLFIVAFCDNYGKMDTFELARIMGENVPETEPFEVMPDFSALDYLDTIWGVTGNGK